jgi:predicted transcriptional regulator
MAVITKKSMLTGIKVNDAMRRQVVKLSMNTSLDQCIRHSIKYKVNAILVTNTSDHAMGVVSKTDLISAYYAGLPLDLPIEEIMVGPPLYCYPDSPLEKSLESMKALGIHRLYVSPDDGKSVVGVLAYPDIVGLLYRFCRKCKRNLTFRKKDEAPDSGEEHIHAKEIMSVSVKAHNTYDTLFEIMETLSAYRFGAVLIRDSKNIPVGVVSKTDLIIAYRHGISGDMSAETVMNAPVRTCYDHDFLVKIIQQMIFSDVHRLFVLSDNPYNIVGVVSLTDTALARSGSCKACIASRFLTSNG